MLPDLHLRRYEQIAEVLLRHGLGWIANAAELERFLPRRQSTAETAPTPPARLRMALEELGITFIKLGQFLSTRPDLMPPEYQAELARLQDDAPPIPPETARERIELELGRPVSDLFAIFEETPLAAASIGQAHAATQFDGTEVVVKVRRPGAVEQVEEDLEILLNLATAMERRLDLAKRFDVVGLAGEFASTIRSELNYLTEGRNAERFAANFAGDASVHIPRIFWETTTSRVLTLERVRGTKISELPVLANATGDRRALAERGTEVILRMIFDHGFFHADLHPGNFFIEEGGRFGLIDFGMVGSLDETAQDHLAGLVLAVTQRDYDRLVDVLLGLGVTRDRIDRQALRRDLERMIDAYYGVSIGELDLAALIDQALAIMRRHRLHLPPNLALLAKTILITEGLGARLDPSFHLLTVIEPYAGRLMLRRHSPRRVLRQLDRMRKDLLWLGAEAPQRLRRLIGDFEQRGFEVGLKPGSLDAVLARLERMVNRIVLGILAAAFIIGLAILLSIYRLPRAQTLAGFMFAIGFVLAALLGGYLALSLLRSRH